MYWHRCKGHIWNKAAVLNTTPTWKKRKTYLFNSWGNHKITRGQARSWRWVLCKILSSIRLHLWFMHLSNFSLIKEYRSHWDNTKTYLLILPTRIRLMLITTSRLVWHNIQCHLSAAKIWTDQQFLISLNRPMVPVEYWEKTNLHKNLQWYTNSAPSTRLKITLKEKTRSILTWCISLLILSSRTLVS